MTNQEALEQKALTSDKSFARTSAETKEIYNLQEVGRLTIERTLSETDGNKSRAAELLGITREVCQVCASA